MSFSVGLVNMPFAAVDLPSIALTQLASVVRERLSDDVSTSIHYLNHDVYRCVGPRLYSRISASVTATASGLGDFLFRPSAFPTEAGEDDSSAYLKRYAWMLAADDGLVSELLEVRSRLDALLDQLVESYRLDACELIGFTSMFAQNMASIALARKLKERRPDLIVVMGGANCETSMGGVLARGVDAVDYVFSGPALRSFPELIARLMRGETEEAGSIRGVLTKNTAAGTESIGEELDIDTPVRLDYSDFLESLDARCPDVTPSLLFETSRGCWWGERAHCTFCGLNGTTMSYRAMRAEAAIAQFEEMFGHFPRVAHFKSVDNILPREYFTEVLPQVKPPGPNVTIFYEIKADVTADEMAVLADAGVTELQPGIEALDTRTLKLMRKGTAAHQNVSFLKNCRRFGIRPIWNLLIGFPGEPESVYQRYVEVLPSLVHLPPPTGVYPVRFDRYSPYYTKAEDYGLELVPYDFYALLYPFPEHELARLAYFFADENPGSEYIERTARWLEPLQRAVESWNEKSREGRPELAFLEAGEREVLVDSRFGRSQEHEIGDVDRKLLDALRKPMRTTDLDKHCAELAPGEVEAALGRLRDRDLLFEEGDRALSLVVESDRDEGFF